MKTLLVSMYDCTTEYSAAMIDESGIVTPIDISGNICHLIYDSNWIAQESDDEEERKKLVKLQRFYDQYDHVIICEEGTIRQVK